MSLVMFEALVEEELAFFFSGYMELALFVELKELGQESLGCI